MRHGIAGRKLGRTSSHRKALFANLATQLLEHEQIQTTLPKAKDLRRVVEPLISKARTGTLAARRDVASVLKSEAVVKKLFDEIAPRFKDTPGGYTRVLKLGNRLGDNAEMAIIELTEGKKATTKKKAASAKKAAPNAEAKAAEETPAEVKELAAEETTPEAPEVPAADASAEAVEEKVEAAAEESSDASKKAE